MVLGKLHCYGKNWETSAHTLDRNPLKMGQGSKHTADTIKLLRKMCDVFLENTQEAMATETGRDKRD